MILSPGHIDPLNYATEIYLFIYLFLKYSWPVWVTVRKSVQNLSTNLL